LSSAKQDDLQLPALAFGYEPVYDYTTGQLGAKTEHGSFLQIDGAWYCPSIPKKQIDTTHDYGKGLIDDAMYSALLEER